MTDKGEKVGAGFRTFSGFDNYIRIVTDPRIQGPFFKIFLWTVAFSGISVVSDFFGRDAACRHPGMERAPLPQRLPDPLDSPVCGSGGAFDPDLQRDVQSGIRCGKPISCEPFLASLPSGKPIHGEPAAMILLVNVWLGYPYMMLVCTGMLQSIPPAIYEASAIDGSGPVVDFFRFNIAARAPPADADSDLEFCVQLQ